jgi:ketosteroid isomerase-like protein
VGTWTSTGRRGDADPSTASERYLVVWVREGDGAWRILYDMWHRPAR